MILIGKGKIQYNLEASPFAQGGEGQIFNIIGQPDKVAKLYKAGKITADHERKLIKMMMFPPDQDVMNQIAWPLDVLYDNGSFVGFVMKKFKLNEDLNVIYEYGSAAKYPNLTWGNKIRIAKNLCVVLNAVHEAGHVCGDFNPKNISVDPNTGHITFVDTDSYHIVDGNNTYRCNVGMPEYLPAEIQSKMQKGLANAPLPTFGTYTDNFALAVHIFQLLMNGVHPFACAVIPSQASVVFPDMSESIMKGECPFFVNVPGRQIPPYAPPADILPDEIKDLFIKAFVKGHKTPSERPSAETWYYALERLEQNLSKCKNVIAHEYYNGLSACPWCAADNRYSSAVTVAKKMTQTSYTPVTPPGHNSSYTPSSASVSSIKGSNSPSYAGANNYGRTSNYKKGGSKGGILKWIIGLGIVAALFAFVIWPKMIYPKMDNADLYTPEIVQIYSRTMDDLMEIVTINECGADGTVLAVREVLKDNSYSKREYSGKVVSKKNNGDMVIELTGGSYIQQNADSKQHDSLTLEIVGDEAADEFLGLRVAAEGWESMLHAGTASTEGLIFSVDDLKNLNNSDGSYLLCTDIDLSGTTWTPIEGFTGTLLGNGFTIKNMTIDASSSNVGFFSILGGSVMNLNFENASVTVSGSQEKIGILCGILDGTVSSVSVSGTVDAKKSQYVGGIAGYVSYYNITDMSALSNAADVAGKEYVGGIFGYQYTGDVTESTLSNSGNITATGNYVGGLIGYAQAEEKYLEWAGKLNITDTLNTGNVIGKEYVGGLFGYILADDQASVITDASCQAAVEADAYAGCIAGCVEKITISDGSNAGSTLKVNKYIILDGAKYAYVGGMVGKGYLFNDCTNEVAIDYTAGGSYVGGIAGYVECGVASMTALENKADISGADYVGGIFGYQHTGDVEETSFSNSGTITADGNYAGGLIGYATAPESWTNWSGTFSMTDASNTGNVKGKEYVGGLFGHVSATVQSSTITEAECQADIEADAYVGCIAGLVKNVVISDCSNSGSTLKANKYVTADGKKYAYVGGFAGKGYLFNNCTNEVAIDYTAGGSYVGGIAGCVESGNARMTALANTADISGADYVGGIFGYQHTGDVEETAFSNSGTITADGNYAGGLMGYATAPESWTNWSGIFYMMDSSNTGDVSGKEYVGGLFGYAYASNQDSALTDCSSTGTVKASSDKGDIAGKLENITVN